jgi:hypothetical protein
LDQFVRLYEDNFEKMDEDKINKKKMELIFEQCKVLFKNQNNLDFDAYARAVKNVWPFLTDKAKNTFFLDAAISAEDRMNFVHSMLDCELEPSTIEAIMHQASQKKNKTAFEFAAERSVKVAKVLESLSIGGNAGSEMFYGALAAGSIKWIEKLIAAGLDRQSVIADHAPYIILLADLDPQGLEEKLKGLKYRIIPLMVQYASTEAGKQALTALMNHAGNNN